jgi:MFS family permease
VTSGAGSPGQRASRAWRWPALAMLAVGYGANQFVPLLAVYRRDLALSDASATAIFGVYALGLIPGFLIGGPASDRYGRRRIMIAFAAISLLASAVLITGRWGAAGLYAGRLLTGVVSGTVFTVGTAWVKELSESSPGAAARRAALALTAGFGVGPLVAGLLAQWAPLPTVLPYLLHLVLGGVTLALLPRAPETRPASPPGSSWQLIPAAVTTARFRRVVAPTAPWVFGSVTLVFTTLPAHGVQPMPETGVVFAGLLAAAALGAGLGGQRWGRRLLHGTTPGGDDTARRDTGVLTIGLAVVTAGVLAAALATARPGLVTVLPATLVLGVGYGVCLVGGLREVERLASPRELGGLVAVFYSLTYSGLAIPFLLALAAPHIGYPAALLLVAAAALGTLVTVSLPGRADR